MFGADVLTQHGVEYIKTATVCAVVVLLLIGAVAFFQKDWRQDRKLEKKAQQSLNDRCILEAYESEFDR